LTTLECKTRTLKLECRYTAVTNMWTILELKCAMWWEYEGKQNAVEKGKTHLLTLTPKLEQFSKQAATNSTDQRFDDCVEFVLNSHLYPDEVPSKITAEAKDKVKACIPDIYVGSFYDRLHPGPEFYSRNGFVMDGSFIAKDTIVAIAAFLTYFNVPYTVMDSSYADTLYTYHSTKQPDTCRDKTIQFPDLYNWIV